MTTSVSSEAVSNYKKYAWTIENLNGGRENCISMFFTFVLLDPDRQADGQNVCRIDAYIWEECVEKKTSCLL